MKAVANLFKQKWFIYIMLIIFAPIGIFLVWRSGKFTLDTKKSLAAASIFIFFIVCINVFSITPKRNTNFQNKSDTLNFEKNPTQSSIENLNENADLNHLEKATVIKVIDSDIIEVQMINGKKEKVRFIGINTPEMTPIKQPYAEEALMFIKEKLLNKQIFIQKDVSDRDQYGRLLRYVWLKTPSEITQDEINSKMFNALIIIRGYAKSVVYPPNVKYSYYLNNAQKDLKHP